MPHDASLCPNCRKTAEETLREARGELAEFLAQADALPLALRARLYTHAYDHICTLHQRLNDCATPEQLSLALSLYDCLDRWGPEDIWIEIAGNTCVNLGSYTRDVDLRISVNSTRPGHGPVLQVAVLCDEQADADALLLDQACLGKGILVFHFTRAQAMDEPGRCADAVQRCLEAMLTIARRAGWVAPKP